MREERFPSEVLLARLLCLEERASAFVSSQKVDGSGHRSHCQLQRSEKPMLFAALEQIPGGPQEACPVDAIRKGRQTSQSFPDSATRFVRSVGERQILRASEESVLELNGCQTIPDGGIHHELDRKSTRLNSSHGYISYAVFCLKKKKKHINHMNMCHKLQHNESSVGQ